MTAHADMSVLFDCRVESVVEADEAFAWISAILVALFLVTLSSFVVLEARATSLLRLVISWHWSFSETALVEVPLWPLAMTAPERRKEKKRTENRILNVYEDNN